MSMTGPQKVFYDSHSDLAALLAVSIADALQADIERRGRALLILAGGSSPKELIRQLAKQELDWTKIIVTTTDERCVATDDPNSNAGQIKRLAGITPFALWDDKAADITNLPWPATVTVLGMGLDGHVASLFSKADLAHTSDNLVKAVAPLPPHKRLSLSLQKLLDTNSLILLVIGAQKRALCERILLGR